jgi:hypothetical protein
MGHLEFALLPITMRWKNVVGLLSAPSIDAPAIAASTCQAAERRLRRLSWDPSLTYCFWLLTRLAAAGRGDDFLGDVARLGVPAQPGDTALQFVARVADHTRVVLSRYPESGPFGEMAALALRRALSETVGTEGRSLRGSALEDLEHAFRRHATDGQFGDIASRFFGAFMTETLRYYVDRGLPQVTEGGLMPGPVVADFNDALTLHARQLGRVVERFAIGWYAKRRWTSLGQVTLEEAGGFVAHALPKLRGALVRGTA